MSIYDFHRRTLSPRLWQPNEQRLRFRPRAQIYEQLDRRFPEATKAYLVGEMTGNYYDSATPVDVLVLVPNDFVQEYREEAKIVSGYKLKGSEHPVFFHILSDEIDAGVVADKFGTLYNLGSGMWLGKRVSDPSALTNPDALLRYIRWRAYRIKDLDEPYPYRWQVLPEAYGQINTEGRQQLTGELRDIVERMRLNARKIAGAYRDENVWNAAGKLELMLQREEPDDDVVDFVQLHNIPALVLKAFYNMYRYKDVLDILEASERNIQRLLDAENAGRGTLLQLASTKKSPPDVLNIGGKLYQRIGAP